MISKLEIVKTTLLAAGKEILKHAPNQVVEHKEGRSNVSTVGDLASEELITQAILSAFPDHQILSEESASSVEDPLQSENLWIIDPIDGTNNYRFGRSYSGISIGYAVHGELQAGGVYNPFADELFCAEKGLGAFLNDRRIKVSKQQDFAEASIATDNSYSPEGTKCNLELLMKLQPTPWCFIRGSAALVMCDVAAGRVDAYFHTALKPFDNSAGFLIAQEAGALIKGIDGESVRLTSCQSTL